MKIRAGKTRRLRSKGESDIYLKKSVIIEVRTESLKDYQIVLEKTKSILLVEKNIHLKTLEGLLDLIGNVLGSLEDTGLALLKAKSEKISKDYAKSIVPGVDDRNKQYRRDIIEKRLKDGSLPPDSKLLDEFPDLVESYRKDN